MSFVLVVLTLFTALTAAEVDADVAPTGMVLTGSELDRGRVEVGMLVEVVHGKGPRHRFSGEWAEVATVRGVIEAVNWDRRQVVVARDGDGGKETIAVDRIQTMTMIASPQAAVGDSAEDVGRFPVQAGRVDDMDPDKRVAKKLSYGALGGVGGGALGAVVGFGLGSYGDKNCGGNDDPFCGAGGVFGSVFVGSIGYSIGTAVGVSRVDPHDLFGASLIGSVVGLVGGIGLMSASESELLFPFLFIGPVVGATLASEWSRSLNPSDKKLPFFMNLVPDSRGRLAAVATLRF